MPREIWSIEIQADVSKALAQLQALRSQIASLGSGTNTITPKFDATGVQKGVNTMNTALAGGQKRATGFIAGLQQDFGNFGRIFASRIAFTFATAVERFIIGSLMLIPKAFAGAISAGAEFENAVRRTATVAAGGFGDIEGAMGKLGKTAREVGATTTFTAVEVASAMFELVSVGLSVAETQDAIVASSELAVAVQTDLATAIDITTQIMKAFGLNSSELADIGDKLTFAIDNTTLNVGRLQSALRFAAPAAGALGISFDDMLTVVAKFVDVTKQGGIAGRAFRFMISALADPTDQAAERIGMLGLTLEQVDPQMNSLTDIMKTFAGTTMDGGDALAIFGKRAGGTVAGAITDIRLGLASGVDELEKFKAGLTEASRLDLAKKQAAEFMQTLTSQWKIFVSKITELGLQIFDVIGPAVILATKAVNGFLDAVITIGPFLKTFLGLLLSIAAVKIVSGLASGTVAMAKFTYQTLLANKAMVGWTSTTLGASSPVKSLNLGMLGLGASSSKLSSIISKIIPFVKKFAGRAGIIGLAAGFITMIKSSVLLNDALKFFGDLIVNVVPGLDSMSEAVEWVNQKLLFMKDMFGVIINQGFDLWVSALIGLYGKLAGVEADILDGFGIMAETSAAMREIEAAAKDAAKHVIDLSMADEDARVASIRMEDAVLSLNEALKVQINSIDTFRTKEQAVVQAYNNMTSAGETQEKALIFLQDALRDLFLNSDLVGGQYSNSLIPIMGEAVTMFNFTGESVDGLAERLELLSGSFDAVFGTVAKDAKESLDELFLALEVVEEGVGTLSEQQLVKLIQRLEELERVAEVSGDEMGPYFKAKLALARLTIQGMSGDIDVMMATATDASYLLGQIPKVLEEADTGFATFATLNAALTEINEKLALAKLLIASGLAPPGTTLGIADDLVAFAKSLVDIELFSGQVSDNFLDTAKNLGFVRKEGESVEQFTTRIADSAKKADSSYAEFFKNIRSGIATALGELIVKGKDFGDTMKKLFDGIFATNLTKGIESAVGAFDTMREAGAGMMESMGKGLEKFRETLNGPVNAALFGAKAAMGGWKDVGMGALSAISNFAKGDWIAGIMATIGVIIGALKNMFGGTTATKELEKIGLSISENLTKKIEEAEKALGDYGAAIRTNLAAIIEEVGIPSIMELNKFLGMQRDLLSDLDRGTITSAQAMNAMNDSMGLLIQSAIDLNSPQAFGTIVQTLTDVINRTMLTGASMITAADATKLLNDQFPALIAASTQFGLAGSEALRNIIEGARAAGLEIESLNAFVIEKSNTIIDSINDLVGSGMKLTAKQVQFAARAMSVAFAEMRASGMTVPEIINAMGDSLRAITDRAKELGIELPESFRLFAGLGPLFENEFVKPKLEGLAAIQAAFIAMSELGIKPTEEDMDTLEQSANRAFRTMIRQGATSREALLALAPTLALIRDNAEKYGLTIDKNTQRLIDQATEAGVLGERQLTETEVMQVGFDNIGLALNRLIETMGGVPVALAEFGPAATVAADDITSAMARTGSAIENDVVQGISNATSAIIDLGSTAAIQMDDFRKAAADAVARTLDEFKRLENDLVGNTIIGDISEKGADFMRDWGAETSVVVGGVQSNFVDLNKDLFGAKTGNNRPVFDRGLAVPPSLGVSPAMKNGGAALRPQSPMELSAVKDLLTRIARGMEDGMRPRIFLDGREISRRVRTDLLNDSLNGRLSLDEGIISQLQG